MVHSKRITPVNSCPAFRKFMEIYSDRKYRLREHVKNVGSFSRRGAVEYIRQENMRDHILTLDFTIHC